jgi:hypothetical protein
MIPDLADRLLAYEMEDMGEEEYLQFFADLISSGWVHHLQGHYGRQAAWLVENGFISLEGEVLRGFGDDY